MRVKGAAINRAFFQHRPHLAPALIAAVACALAVFHWPYAYYRLLRRLVAVCGVWTVAVAPKPRQIWACCIVSVTVVAFNPLIPFRFTRATWAVLDLVSAGVFLVVAFFMRAKPRAGLPGGVAGTNERGKV